MFRKVRGGLKFCFDQHRLQKLRAYKDTGMHIEQGIFGEGFRISTYNQKLFKFIALGFLASDRLKFKNLPKTRFIFSSSSLA